MSELSRRSQETTPSSSSFGQESGNFEQERRPNRVISGHRNFGRTFYTGPTGNFDSHANIIVAKMEQDETLMEDTPVAEQLRKEALKDLPQCLTIKRCVKMKLSKSVSQKSKRRPISFWKRVKYRINISFNKFVDSLKNFNYFELWHGTLKDIEGRFGSGYASYFKFLRWLFVMNFLLAVLSLVLVVVPQIVYDASGSNGTLHNTNSFNIKDIFVGHGMLEETVLYYGHYTDQSIQLIPHLAFDMPAAYFSVMAVLYMISFVALAVSVAESYRRSFIETEGGLQNVFASKIFCAWDFGIATKEAAALKSSAIYNELRELLSDAIKNDPRRSCLHKFYTSIIQIVVNLLVLVILGAVGWLTWMLLTRFSLDNSDNILITPVVVNIIIMIIPIIFNYIAKYEDYNNPRTAIYITLFRTFLLGSVIVGVILTFWLKESGNINCWENRIASEIYRLILFDFIFSVIFTALFDIGSLIIQKFIGRDPKSEFNIAKHTLQIIYNQALFWVGFLYSPILPAIVTLKMFIIWYVTEWCVRKLCKPPKKTWRAAQAQTWFMMMIFVSILLIVAVHGYTITSVPPSNCGPFQDYNSSIYEIVTSNIVNLEEGSTFWRVVMNVFKPGGVTLILIALGVIVYYTREQAVAQQEKVNMLREMVVWMAKDKRFLVQLYNEATKGELDVRMRDNRFVDPRVLLPQECFGEPSGGIDEDEFNSRFQRYS
jgi:hypothetical protein